MDDFNKILKLVDDERVSFGLNIPKNLLHKKLILGQSRYLCRYGTLSDGHEKITDAQKLYQAYRESYALACNISNQKVIALRAQADLIDATEKQNSAIKNSDKLRADADYMDANNRLISASITIEDQLRMLDEYCKIIKELEPSVDAKYPEGIEQAEFDNWMAVFHYRMFKGDGKCDNIPLPPEVKHNLGLRYNNNEALAAGLDFKKINELTCSN